MELGVEIGKLLVALLVLINPFSALSIYLDLTQDHSTQRKTQNCAYCRTSSFIVLRLCAGRRYLVESTRYQRGSFQVAAVFWFC